MPDAGRGLYADLNAKDLAHLGGAFHGIIQHSFALQLPYVRDFRETSGWVPRRGRQTKSVANVSRRQRRYHMETSELLTRMFADPTGAFDFVDPPSRQGRKAIEDLARYSELLAHDAATLDPRLLGLLADGPLPPTLSWADKSIRDRPHMAAQDWDGLVFAHRAKRHRWSAEQTIVNDKLLRQLVPLDADCQLLAVSDLLFELWAHWRCRLFGVSLSARFFNVFLPPAILGVGADRPPVRERAVRTDVPLGALLLQPFASFVREPDRAYPRRTFAFTLLLLPVSSHELAEPRRMSLREIEASVRGAWGLAAQRVGANRQPYLLGGPLRAYLGNVGQPVSDRELTIRQWAERVMYGVSHLQRERLRRRLRRHRMPDDPELGDRVLTALATSRASAVTVVDRTIGREDVRAWAEADTSSGPRDAVLFPGALPELIRAVSGRMYLGEKPCYRLDTPFLDRDYYAKVAAPSARTVLTVTTPDSQERFEGSGLVESLYSGYMVLGAATAQALIRSAYHEIESRTDPKQFGEVSKEFTRDFHEIYDLDIAWESYKRTYRTLLEQLDIIHDYENLHRKLSTLFDATVAEFGEWQHTRLVVVSWLAVLVAVATVILSVVKP